MITAAAALYWSTSVPALAADGRGFYVGAGVGRATNTTENDAGGDSLKDSDRSLRVFVGYSIWKYLALEAEYLDGGKTEGFVGPYALELEPSSVIGSVIGTWPIGRWGLSAKLGYAFYDVDQSIRLGTLRHSDSHQDERFAGALAASFDFAPRYSARLEYQAFHLDDGTFSNVSLNGIFKF